MLTQTDLNKIGQIVDEKLDAKLNSEFKSFESKLDSKFDQKLKPIKSDLKKIRKDLEFVVGVLDKDRWRLEQKFDSHTSHPPRAFAA